MTAKLQVQILSAFYLSADLARLSRGSREIKFSLFTVNLLNSDMNRSLQKPSNNGKGSIAATSANTTSSGYDC
ncbi:hypothetical protein [Paenibacillus sp. FSL E2-0178]|uniref:hypothetical protein n=1 Tax=Paenibacillus sp. FSL E2-0178 TaxID=2921361 RepID=UPI003157FF52